jgi:hypothetical protein
MTQITTVAGVSRYSSDVRKASSVLMIFQLYRARGGQFNWWRKPEYLEKTTDLPK